MRVQESPSSGRRVPPPLTTCRLDAAGSVVDSYSEE